MFLELFGNAAGVCASFVAIAHELDHDGDDSGEDKKRNEYEQNSSGPRDMYCLSFMNVGITVSLA